MAIVVSGAGTTRHEQAVADAADLGIQRGVGGYHYYAVNPDKLVEDLQNKFFADNPGATYTEFNQWLADNQDRVTATIRGKKLPLASMTRLVGPLSTDPETLLGQIAARQLAGTEDIRQQELSRFEDMLSGGYDWQSDPRFQALYADRRAGAEDQYSQAVEAAIAGARGGGMDRALGNAEYGRAVGVGSLPGLISQQILGEEYARAMGVALGQPLNQSVQGLSNLTGSLAQRDASSILADAQTNIGNLNALGTIGTGLGTAYGIYQGKPLTPQEQMQALLKTPKSAMNTGYGYYGS